MSDSCPTNVCVAFPLRISHNFAVASQAPETKVFWPGARDKLDTWSIRYTKSAVLHQENIPHDISSVVAELHDPYTSLDIPQHTGHITAASNYLSVIDEATA